MTIKRGTYNCLRNYAGSSSTVTMTIEDAILEYDENYTQEEIDYTNALANMEVLDLKGIEEKIEDEKRSTSNETKK